MDHYNDSTINIKYLLVNEKDKEFGLWVNTVGFQPISKGSKYPSTEHPSNYYFNTDKGRTLREYQVLYITKGEGYFKSAYIKKTKIEKGTMIMLFPNEWHTYSPNPQYGWNEYYIGFEGAVIDNLIKSSFFNKENPILEVGVHESLVNLFTRCIHIARDEKLAMQQHLAGIVLHILGKILSLSKNKNSENLEIYQKIERAKIIMIENIHKSISPQEIAAKLNVSYSWFRKAFKNYTDCAPSQYFQNVKMNEAKRLLTETEKSVKEIAYILDFTSTEHFYSVFKKKTGFTPIAYRDYINS